jgi:hypothetical protein
MQPHRIALLDEHFNEARRAVGLSEKRGATPVPGCRRCTFQQNKG